MIKSTVKAKYGKPKSGLKEDFVRIEIVNIEVNEHGFKYKIDHFAIVDIQTGAKVWIDKSEKEMSIAEYNFLCANTELMMEQYDTVGMTPWEKEQLKMKIGLLLYIQNDFLPDENNNPTDKVVWGLLPGDYEIML